MTDRDSKGRQYDRRGEKHGKSKMTKMSVRELRRSWEQNKKLPRENRMRILDYAKKYNVSNGCIEGIVYGKNWVEV
jgi:hypothetical protein